MPAKVLQVKSLIEQEDYVCVFIAGIAWGLAGTGYEKFAIASVIIGVISNGLNILLVRLLPAGGYGHPDHPIRNFG